MVEWRAYVAVNRFIVDSVNGLLTARGQVVPNDDSLVIRPLGINFSEIVINSNMKAVNKMQMKIPFSKWRAFC